MPDLNRSYEQLITALRRVHTLGTVSDLVGWDEKVNLPPKSVDLRTEQLALLAEMRHEAASRPEIGKCLDRLENQSEHLSADQQAVIRDARRDYDKATRLPADLIQRKAKAESRGYHAWIEARAADNYAKFAPFLKEHLELAREEAAMMGADTGSSYDYWIDQFDPGMQGATIEPLFAALLPELKRLVAMVERSKTVPLTDAFRGLGEDRQAEFAAEVIRKMGFDFDRGRIDRSAHPFCGGEARDTRLTTRYDPDDPLESLFSVIHEAGHGMYEQGLPHEHLGTALGTNVGMAIHESQSRLWENQVARSRAFWRFWEQPYRKLFSSRLAEVSSDEFYRALNHVAITPIRVSADEVTYNLHIMLRFSLEQKLFSGALDVDDLPEGWNAESERILGLRPPSHALGCLQDVHWSCGLFGYFPSYCLGNLIAAQWWEALHQQIPELENQIAAGDYAPLLDWLRRNVHRQGRRYRTGDLVAHVTGKPLSHEPLVRYLNDRFQPIYGDG